MAQPRTSSWTSSSRSRAMKIMALTRSAPSSIVTCGLVLQGGGDVPVVARLVLALDGVDRDVEVVDQAGRDVVLGRERVGGDQDEVGAAGLRGSGPGWPSRPSRAGRPTSAGRPAASRPRTARGSPGARACPAPPRGSAGSRRWPGRGPSRHPQPWSPRCQSPEDIRRAPGREGRRQAVTRAHRTANRSVRRPEQAERLLPLPVHPVERPGGGPGRSCISRAIASPWALAWVGVRSEASLTRASNRAQSSADIATRSARLVHSGGSRGCKRPKPPLLLRSPPTPPTITIHGHDLDSGSTRRSPTFVEPPSELNDSRTYVSSESSVRGFPRARRGSPRRETRRRP